MKIFLQYELCSPNKTGSVVWALTKKEEQVLLIF